MNQVVSLNFCPLAKYITREDRFCYNEAYLKYFNASSNQDILKRILLARKGLKGENSFSVASIRSFMEEYIILLHYSQEHELYFFIFINYCLMKSVYQKIKNINEKDCNILDADITVINENGILKEILTEFKYIYGISAEEIIETIPVELEAIDKEQHNSDFIIGSSHQIKRIIGTIKRVAPFDATILLTGESGVGKNRFAGMIHSFSERRSAPFITINCGAIPDNLLESELFGYEKGAFTGASNKGKVGLIETANHGTLFLDEIGDLPMQMQAKLLKVIQEKKITRVGGIKEKDVDFRLITATNRDIPSLIESGDFRKDLFYRLNVISITIPSIRDRNEDISNFINYFTAKYNEKYGKSHVFSNKAIEIMEKYAWPGNVRELENVVEGIILTADNYVITEDMLPTNISSKTIMEKYDVKGKTLKQILENVEKQILMEAYEKYGTTTKVAKALGISQASVSIKLKKYAFKSD